MSTFQNQDTSLFMTLSSVPKGAWIREAPLNNCSSETQLIGSGK